MNVIQDNHITGIILAGGKAKRMGGQDKGLIRLANKTMVEHIATALGPQVGTLLVNANRNPERYRRFGYPVVPDQVGGYLGPLAGMASGMEHAKTTYVVTVPCDSPLIPPDLVGRLYRAMVAEQAEISVAHDGQRMQPVFALLRTTLQDSIKKFLAGGDRKTILWYAWHKMALADFSDHPNMFLNVNTPEDGKALEGFLVSSADKMSHSG